MNNALVCDRPIFVREDREDRSSGSYSKPYSSKYDDWWGYDSWYWYRPHYSWWYPEPWSYYSSNKYYTQRQVSRRGICLHLLLSLQAS